MIQCCTAQIRLVTWSHSCYIWRLPCSHRPGTVPLGEKLRTKKAQHSVTTWPSDLVVLEESLWLVIDVIDVIESGEEYMKNCRWLDDWPKIAEYAGLCISWYSCQCVDDLPRTCVKDGVSYQISNQIHVNHSKSNNFNNRVLPLCLHCWRILRTTSFDTGLIFHWMSVDGTLWFSKLKIKDLPIQTLKFWEPFQRDILLMSDQRSQMCVPLLDC